jgi:cell division protein FtsB
LPGLAKSTKTDTILPSLVNALPMVPSWIILGMILLATLGVCSTVILRTRAELSDSALQYQRIALEVNSIRRSNESLETEISKMSSDPSVIESSARARLGMVRPNDVVVPVGALQTVASASMGSFVR